MNLSGLLVFLTAALAGSVTAGITAFAMRRRNNSEADKFTAEAAKDIADAATELIHERGAMAAESEKRLEAQIHELEERIQHLSTVVSALTMQLQQAGLQPAIPPTPNGGQV